MRKNDAFATDQVERRFAFLVVSRISYPNDTHLFELRATGSTDERQCVAISANPVRGSRRIASDRGLDGWDKPLEAELASVILARPGGILGTRDAARSRFSGGAGACTYAYTPVEKSAAFNITKRAIRSGKGVCPDSGAVKC